MVKEEEIVKRVREILETSDLNTTSAGGVRRQLEKEFGVDLSHLKKFISFHIDSILNEPDEHQLIDGDHPIHDVVDDEHHLIDGEQPTEDDVDDEEAPHPHSPKQKKRKGGGFTKLCSLSPQLQDIVGVSELARTEVVKKMWDYIKEHDLQDPANRRNILCDPKLHSLFHVDKINMFQMNKALSKHIWPLDPHQECSVSSPAPPEKKQKRQKEEDVEKPKGKAKQQQKGGTSGFLKPLQMSDAFVKFLGTGETTLSRSDAVKKIWDYIKQNDLQDPSDKRRILCDEKLKELFKVDTFNGFSVTKFLTAHLSKLEQ